MYTTNNNNNNNNNNNDINNNIIIKQYYNDTIKHNRYIKSIAGYPRTIINS